MTKESDLVTRNRRLAEAGCAAAQFSLGNMYRIGFRERHLREFHRPLIESGFGS